MDNPNQFDYVGGNPVGCSTGAHLWDEQEGHIGVEQDGDLTKLKLRCLRCGRQFDISAPLEINRFIKSGNNIQPPSTYRTAPPEMRVQERKQIEDSDILTRILG